jgi:hypothetical protein
MITKSDWQTIQQELLDGNQEPLGDPPTAEEMLAYMRGELAPNDEERVRRLLVCYPELAHALTAPFPEDDAMPGDADYLGPEELTRRWMELRRRIEGRADGGTVVQFWRRTTAAIAAALVLAIGGLLVQAQWTAQRLRVELAKPRVPSEEILLLPDGQRGLPGGTPTVSENAESVLLVTPLVGAVSPREYRLAMVDETGHVLWTSPPLRERNNDTFAILVPRAFLKRGKHQVVLYGVDGSRQEELARYSLRVP